MLKNKVVTKNSKARLQKQGWLVFSAADCTNHHHKSIQTKWEISKFNVVSPTVEGGVHVWHDMTHAHVESVSVSSGVTRYPGARQGSAPGPTSSMKDDKKKLYK